MSNDSANGSLLFRFVIQRVLSAEVIIEGESCGKMQKGLLVFVGIGQLQPQLTPEEFIDQSEVLQIIGKSLDKIKAMRIFEDENGKMNLSVDDIDGGLYIVSQFTLFADVKKGNRPGFSGALKPDRAKIIYRDFINAAKSKAANSKIFTGEFGADMKVTLLNDGPVTILFDVDKNGVQ